MQTVFNEVRSRAALLNILGSDVGFVTAMSLNKGGTTEILPFRPYLGMKRLFCCF